MIERMCLGGRVRLVFEVGRMPRPDTSRNVQWIRQHAGSIGSQESVVSFIHQRPNFRVTQGARAGVITVTIRLNLLHLYVARELRPYPPAVMAAVVQHEEGHVPAWERVMAANLEDIGTELGSRISPPASATVRQVTGIVQSFSAQWALLCRQAADRWDDADYPRLHRVLRGADVPSL